MNMFDRTVMPLATRADAEKFRELDNKKKRKQTPEEKAASQAFNKAKAIIESLRVWSCKSQFESGDFAESYAAAITTAIQREMLAPLLKKLIGFKFRDAAPSEDDE